MIFHDCHSDLVWRVLVSQPKYLPRLATHANFRADYLEREFTPHLLAIGNYGLRARWLQLFYLVCIPFALFVI